MNVEANYCNLPFHRWGTDCGKITCPRLPPDISPLLTWDLRTGFLILSDQMWKICEPNWEWSNSFIEHTMFSSTINDHGLCCIFTCISLRKFLEVSSWNEGKKKKGIIFCYWFMMYRDLIPVLMSVYINALFIGFLIFCRPQGPGGCEGNAQIKF